MASPPVVVRARELGLDVAQPKALKSGPFPERFAAAKADVAVVVAYGRILTPHYLGGPRYGCVNVHGSLLPRWRGAAPIQAAILAGDATSGVSTQRMVERLDAGDVYLSREIPLDPRETGGSLHDRLMALGAEVLVDTLAKLPDLRPVPQDESLATFCRPLTKDDGRVDFGEPAAAIDRRIRAMTPWPGGWVPWDGGPLKLLDVAPVDGAGPPGVVLSVDPARDRVRGRRRSGRSGPSAGSQAGHRGRAGPRPAPDDRRAAPRSGLRERPRAGIVGAACRESSWSAGGLVSSSSLRSVRRDACRSFRGSPKPSGSPPPRRARA
jgi:methionyl-tRNA formyltransferase